MVSFDPVSAAIGGALIGLSATLLMLLTGRIAGVAGILGDLIGSTERAWRLAFVLGVIAAPLALGAGGLALRAPPMPGLLVVALAGLLVGFGTRLGNGCTSGHGICGIARLSPRSIVATMTFMLVAMLVVAITRHAL
jgi:uncharacterized membrane protein YedE/YeeE